MSAAMLFPNVGRGQALGILVSRITIASEIPPQLSPDARQIPRHGTGLRERILLRRTIKRTDWLAAESTCDKSYQYDP